MELPPLLGSALHSVEEGHSDDVTLLLPLFGRRHRIGTTVSIAIIRIRIGCVTAKHLMTDRAGINFSQQRCFNF